LYFWSPTVGERANAILNGHEPFENGDFWILGFAYALPVLIGIATGFLVPAIGRSVRTRVNKSSMIRRFLPLEWKRANHMFACTVILAELLWCAWLFGRHVYDGPRSFMFPDHYKFSRFVSGMENGLPFTVYEGLPHQIDEAMLLSREQATKKTFAVNPRLPFYEGGFSFYERPLEISAEDRETLRRIATSSKSYYIATPKACGPFHPDYALAWNDEGNTCYILMCFGCDQVLFHDAKRNLGADIGEGTAHELHALLTKYRRQRPIPRKEGGENEEAREP